MFQDWNAKNKDFSSAEEYPIEVYNTVVLREFRVFS